MKFLDVVRLCLPIGIRAVMGYTTVILLLGLYSGRCLLAGGSRNGEGGVSHLPYQELPPGV